MTPDHAEATVDGRDAAIARQYEAYKQRRDERRVAEEKRTEEQVREKAARDAAYASLQKPPRTVTTIKPHPCHGCGGTISAGQKVTTGTDFLRDRNFNPAFVTLYFCQKCRPVSPVDASKPKEAY